MQIVEEIFINGISVSISVLSDAQGRGSSRSSKELLMSVYARRATPGVVKG